MLRTHTKHNTYCACAHKSHDKHKILHNAHHIIFTFNSLRLVPLTQSNMKIKGNSTTPERLDTVTIECNATAIPPANLTWKIRKTEGIQTLHTTSPRISITHQQINTPNGPTSRSTLTISNVEAADNGVYICEANNDPSSPSVSANFTLCIIGKTIIIINTIIRLNLL